MPARSPSFPLYESLPFVVPLSTQIGLDGDEPLSPFVRETKFKRFGYTKKRASGIFEWSTLLLSTFPSRVCWARQWRALLRTPRPLQHRKHKHKEREKKKKRVILQPPNSEHRWRFDTRRCFAPPAAA